MKNRYYKKVFFLFSLLTFCSSLYCLDNKIEPVNNEPEIESWESEDLDTGYPFYSKQKKEYLSLSQNVGKYLIGIYQKKISGNSIHRCPFYISCSHYALQGIRDHGLFIGLLLFVDRNFYREHKAALIYYPLRETKDYILLLDDSFYLQ